jgi:hypothetical protein
MAAEDFDPSQKDTTGMSLNDYVAQDNAGMAAAHDKDTAQKAQTAFAGAGPQDVDSDGTPLKGGDSQPQSSVSRWLTNLPANVNTGILDAAVQTADAMKSGFHTLVNGIEGTTNYEIPDAQARAMDAAGIPRGAKAGQPLLHPEAKDPFDDIYGHARAAVVDFRDYLAVGSSASGQAASGADKVTQSLAQFAVPFTGYSRMLGGMNALGKATIAGAVTGGTAFDPHSQRLSDIVQLERHTEGKFADALNAASPDGSLLNSYINWQTNRDDESEGSGRFKNAVDTIVQNVALTPLFMAGASVLKAGTEGIRRAAVAGATSTADLVKPPPIGQELTDMSLSPEDRAARRADVAAQRDAADPNSGSNSMPTVEPPTAYQANAEGEAVRRDREEAAGQPVSRLSADLEKDQAITGARTFLKAQTDAKHEGSLHAMATSLGQHIDSSTPDGAFYKDILGRISARNLSTTIVAPGTGAQRSTEAAGPSIGGLYRADEDTVALHPASFRSNTDLIHTFTHEAVHAATMDAINTSAPVKQALAGLIEEAKPSAVGLSKNTTYGLKNPLEFVAEAESNPKFQNLLKTTKSTDGRPLWDHYKDVIGGMLGLSTAAIASPQFEKVLAKENPGA